MSYLSLAITGPRDLPELISDKLLYPARVAFNGHKIEYAPSQKHPFKDSRSQRSLYPIWVAFEGHPDDYAPQKKIPLTSGLIHRITMTVLAAVGFLFGLIGLALARISITRNEKRVYREAIISRASFSLANSLAPDLEDYLEGVEIGRLGKSTQNDSQIFSGTHGPFFILPHVVNDSLGETKKVALQAVFVPFASDKELLKIALDRAAAHGFLTKTESEAMKKIIFTHREIYSKTVPFF